jgi:hypothetical protein
MFGKSTIYGKFISEEPDFDEFVLSTPDSLSGKYTVTEHGKTVALFFLGSGTSLRIFGQETGLKLDSRTAYLHGVSVTEGQDAVWGFLLKRIGNMLLDKGIDKLLICVRDEDAMLEGLGFCKLAEFGSAVPGLPALRFNEPQVPLLSSMKSSFRSTFPQVASALYSLSPKRGISFSIMSGFVAGKQAKVLFAGYEHTTLLYSSSIFDNPHPTSIRFDTIDKGGLPSLISSTSPDLVVRSMPKHEAGGDMLLLPTFVRSLIPITGSLQDYVKKLNKTTRRTIRNLDLKGFHSVPTEDYLDLLLFFRLMHLPMLSERHKNHAVMSSWADVRRAFSKGFLLLVKEGNSPIAATLMERCGKRLYGKYLGILGGDFRHTREGANHAGAFHSIRYAFENGYEVLDLGHSAPFRSDGLYGFKSKWCPKVVQGSDRGSVLGISFRDEGMKERFIRQKGPITIEDVKEEFID